MFLTYVLKKPKKIFFSEAPDWNLTQAGQPRHTHSLVAALALLLLLLTACDMPPSSISLDSVLKEEGRSHEDFSGYRCTRGAHRGASTQHRENTLDALKAADENPKYAFIEFDVQYSKDQRIVVYHDQMLLRLHRSLKRISETSFTELSRITNGEVVAYDEIAGLLGKKLNIEIKSQGDIQEDRRLVDEIMADIRLRQRQKDVMISSISSDILRYINQHYPDVPTGQIFWITSSTYLPFDALTKKLYEEINNTQVDYLMLHVANLQNLKDLLKFKPRGRTILFWDFDDAMYLVHKDLSDRLWGESWLQTFLQFVSFKFISAFNN